MPKSENPTLRLNERNSLRLLFEEFGIVYSTTQNRWTITSNAHQLKRNLSAKWRTFSSIQIAECTESLRDLLSEEILFKISMLPLLPASVPPTSSANLASYQQPCNFAQESLLRFFLEMRNIQNSMISFLLNKLLDYEYHDNESIGDNMPKLILAQLRWLPWIESPKSLAQTVQHVLELSNSTSLKREIITWIPEIADDDTLTKIVPTLLEKMEHEPELLSSVLDTISHLRLNDANLTEIQQVSTELLASVDPENVPVLVKSLLNNVETERLPKLFKDLRAKLKLETLFAPSTTSTPSNVPTMLLECIKAGIRLRPELATAFLQEFSAFSPKESDKSSTNAMQHGILDLWFIYAIYANLEQFKPRVEQALRKKLLREQLRAPLLAKSLTLHPTALFDMWPTVLELAHVLLYHCYQDTGISLAQAAIALYSALFAISDLPTRQSVLSQLMRHVSSASHKEAHYALIALDRLTAKQPKNIEPFASYLQGLIDFMDGSKLDNSQLLQVYSIFAKLAYPHGPLSFSTRRETKAAEFLTMLLLKQLSNPEARYRQMGALGCVALVCVLGAPAGPNALGEEELQEHLNESLDRVKEILDSAFEIHTPEALELFLDEMSRTLTQRAQERPLRHEVMHHLLFLTSQYISHLSRPRMLAIAQARPGTDLAVVNGQLSESQIMSLRKATSNIWCDIVLEWPETHDTYAKLMKNAICFDLYMDETCHRTTKFSQTPIDQIATLSAMIRLLFIVHEHCKRMEDVTLALFSCIHLFPLPSATTVSMLHAIFNSQSQKTLELMATQLIHAINFCRELLATTCRNVLFSSPNIGIPMEQSLYIRVTQLLQLEAYLEPLLDHLSEFPTPNSISSYQPIIHAEEILRETETRTKKPVSNRMRASKKSNAGKPTASGSTGTESGATEHMDSKIRDHDLEAEEDAEEMEDSDDEVTSAVSTTSTSGVGASGKSWGYTGSFDIKKYRKNIIERASLCLRPMAACSANALYHLNEKHIDNQVRWMLLSDLHSKVQSLVPKKSAVNPARQKPDPAWLRAYPTYLDCIFEMIPAFVAIPRQLATLITTSSTPASANTPPQIGAFGAEYICSHLNVPCVRLSLQLLRSIFSMPLFYERYEKEPNQNSSVVQDVAQSIIDSLNPISSNSMETNDEVKCENWTQLAQTSFARLSKLFHTITDFESAVLLLEVLSEIATSIVDDSDCVRQLQQECSVLAYGLLNRHWTDGNEEPSAENSIFRENQKQVPLEALEKLISIYLGVRELVDMNLQLLAKGMSKLVCEMDAKVNGQPNAADGEGEAVSFFVLTPPTLPTFFKVVLDRTNATLASITTKTDEHEVAEEGSESAREKLLSITRALQVCAFVYKKAMPKEVDKSMVGVALKQGRQTVDVFQTKCEWICGQVSQFPMEVQRAMKTYQHATRTLQRLCSLVKEKQYRQLGRLVAPLKKAIETVISRMRLLSDKFGFGDLIDVRVSMLNVMVPIRGLDEAENDIAQDDSSNEEDAEDSHQAIRRKKRKSDVNAEQLTVNEEMDGERAPPRKLSKLAQ